MSLDSQGGGEVYSQSYPQACMRKRCASAAVCYVKDAKPLYCGRRSLSNGYIFVTIDRSVRFCFSPGNLSSRYSQGYPQLLWISESNWRRGSVWMFRLITRA